MHKTEESHTFTALSSALDQHFIVHTQSGPLELTLCKALELPRRGLPEQFRTPVMLVFSGPTTPLLTQGCYTLEHPQLGRNEWVMVPVSSHAVAGNSGTGSPLYEIIFN